MSQDREPLSPLEQRMLDGLLAVAGQEEVHSGRKRRYPWLAVAAVTVLSLGAAAAVPALLAPSTPDSPAAPVQPPPAPGNTGYVKFISGARYTYTKFLDNNYVDVTAEIRGTDELWAEFGDPRSARVKLQAHQVLDCAPADQRGLCANWLADNTGKGLGLRLETEDRTLRGLGRFPEADATGLSHQTLNQLPVNTVAGRPVAELAAEADQLSGQFDELATTARRHKLEPPPLPEERLRLALELLRAIGSTGAQRAAAWTVLQRATGATETPGTDRLNRPGRVLEFGASPGARRQVVVDPVSHTLLSESESYPPAKETERPKTPVRTGDYTLYLSAGAVHTLTESR